MKINMCIQKVTSPQDMVSTDKEKAFLLILEIDRKLRDQPKDLRNYEITVPVPDWFTGGVGYEITQIYKATGWHHATWNRINPCEGMQQIQIRLYS